MDKKELRSLIKEELVKLLPENDNYNEIDVQKYDKLMDAMDLLINKLKSNKLVVAHPEAENSVGELRNSFEKVEAVCKDILGVTENTIEIKEDVDLENVKYNSSLKKEVDKLVDQLKDASLNKTQVAAILNDIILALDLNKAYMTTIMNQIGRARQRYKF